MASRTSGGVSGDEGLGAAAGVFGLALEDLVLVTEGVMNKHWRARGRDLILRRYGRGRTREAVMYEHVVLVRLHRAGWPVSVPLQTPDGKTVIERGRRLYALFPLLRGEAMGKSPDEIRRLGSTAARLHGDSEALLNLGPRPGVDRLLNVGTGWPGWADEESMDRILATVRSHPLVDGRRVEFEIDALGEDIHDVDPGRLPEAIIHGDLGPHHLLWNEGTLSGLLDFDSAMPDYRVVDLAVASHLYLNDPSQLGDLVRGYTAVSPLTETELRVLVPLRRSWEMRHVLFCAAALGRARSAAQRDQFAKELAGSLGKLETQRECGLRLTEIALASAHL